MTILAVSEVTALHEKLIAATGGSPGIRDAGLLESPVLNCYQSFGEDELYPGAAEKAAANKNFSKSRAPDCVCVRQNAAPTISCRRLNCNPNPEQS